MPSSQIEERKQGRKDCYEISTSQVVKSNREDRKERTNQSSDILHYSQNRPTGDRWLKL